MVGIPEVSPSVGWTSMGGGAARADVVGRLTDALVVSSKGLKRLVQMP